MPISSPAITLALRQYVSHYGVQSDPEGDLWRDPPDYWENIVYPAYVDAHKDVFENGDVESGKLAKNVDGLVLLDMLDTSMTEAVERCCEIIYGVAKTAYSSAATDVE